MSDPDMTTPLSPTSGSPSAGAEPRSGGLRRITLLASAAATAVVAVLFGAIVAFQASDNVLSPGDVAQRLAADASSAPDDNPSGDDLSPSPDGSASGQAGGAAGTPSVIDTVAATITISCDGTRMTNATWSIKPGYRLDDRQQNSTSVVLRIESDTKDDLLVKAVCPASVAVRTELDDHGGTKGGGGKGRG